jgi:hypothetical protein
MLQEWKVQEIVTGSFPVKDFNLRVLVRNINFVKFIYITK